MYTEPRIFFWLKNQGFEPHLLHTSSDSQAKELGVAICVISRVSWQTQIITPTKHYVHSSANTLNIFNMLGLIKLSAASASLFWSLVYAPQVYQMAHCWPSMRTIPRRVQLCQMPNYLTQITPIKLCYHFNSYTII